MEQRSDTFHTNDLLGHGAVQGHLQELGTALLCAVLDDQAIRAASDDIHITLEVRVIFVAHVVEVQTLDGWVQDVCVDVENYLLNRLSSITHQHGHTGRRTTDRTHARVVTRDVARNTRILISAGRKLVEDRHQLTCYTGGLEELDSLRTGPHRVVGELPGFPRSHRREVFTGWQTVDVVPNLRTGRNTHVVSHRASRVVTHRLTVAHQVWYAITPERAWDFLKRRLEVWFTVERVVVEDRLDNPVTNQPHFAVILFGRINFTHLRVFLQPPLDEHLTHNPAPKLDRVDLCFRVGHHC